MSQSIIKWRGLESERCSLFVDSYIFEKSICQDEKDKIECYGGRKIKITLAYYGRTKVFKCGLGFSTNCKAKGSEDKVTPDKPHLIRTGMQCFPCPWEKKALTFSVNSTRLIPTSR